MSDQSREEELMEKSLQEDGKKSKESIVSVDTQEILHCLDDSKEDDAQQNETKKEIKDQPNQVSPRPSSS